MELAHWLEELVSFLAHNREPVLRLLLAAALGGFIGLEREASGKPAGFRTNLLICLGAALITQISAVIAADATLPGGFRSDPGRITAQIVSGIGFLGAGTILHGRGSVTGLTTAATLWVVAAIGIAVGAAAYVQALAATGLVLLALMILGRFEDHLLPRRAAERTFRVVLEPRPDLVSAIETILIETGLQVAAIDVEKTATAFIASYGTRGVDTSSEDALKRLLAEHGVQHVSVL